MSDWSGKHRPILELIARLSGRSIGVPTFGGSAPVLTDQDIAGAVAMARQTERLPGRRYPTAVNSCVRPELLLLHYAGQSIYVPVATRAAAAAIREERPGTRYACYLAAQRLGGRVVGEDHIRHAAWMLSFDQTTLTREIVRASAWLEEELHAAERAYCRAMRRWTQQQAA